LNRFPPVIRIKYQFKDYNLTVWSKCESDFRAPSVEEGTHSNKFTDIVDEIADIIDKKSVSAVVQGFSDKVCKLIPNSKKRNLVAFFKYLIKNDDEVQDEDFKPCLGKTKKKFLEFEYGEGSYAEFFAGLFLYAMSAIKNREGRGCNNKEYAKCPVKKAKSNPGEKYDSKQQVKPEYADKVNDAIKSCDKDCALKITEEYIRSFKCDSITDEGAEEKPKTSLKIIESEIDEQYRILAPDTQGEETKTTYNDSYVSVSVKLQNSGNATVLINRLFIKVESYVIDDTPHFKYSATVENGELVICALNNGWGDSKNTAFSISLSRADNSPINFSDKTKEQCEVDFLKSEDTVEIFRISTSDLSLKKDSVIENIRINLSSSFQYSGKTMDFNDEFKLPVTRDCQSTIVIKDSNFAILDKYNNTDYKVIAPSVFYAAVIDCCGTKEYKISRAISSNEIDAFNLYIGSNKSAIIKFRLVFAHNNIELAKSDCINARIVTYTDSRSYNRVIDGQEVGIDNFVNVRRFSVPNLIINL